MVVRVLPRRVILDMHAPRAVREWHDAFGYRPLLHSEQHSLLVCIYPYIVLFSWVGLLLWKGEEERVAAALPRLMVLQ